MTQENRIKSARKRLSMSQAVLARHINVDQSSIAYWESGRTAPKQSRVVELADVLGVTPEWLQFGVSQSSASVEIPVVAAIGDHDEGAAVFSESTGATVDFDLASESSENIAITVSGNSLAPVYHDGDVLIGPRLSPEAALREIHADSVYGMRDGRALLVRAPAGRDVPSGPIANTDKIAWVMPVTWIRKNTHQRQPAATAQPVDGVPSTDSRYDATERRISAVGSF